MIIWVSMILWEDTLEVINQELEYLNFKQTTLRSSKLCLKCLNYKVNMYETIQKIQVGIWYDFLMSATLSNRMEFLVMWCVFGFFLILYKGKPNNGLITYKRAITSWEVLEEKSRLRFFPYNKIVDARADLTNLCQQFGEHLYEVLKRFKLLVRQSPCHNLEKWVLL